MEAEDDYYKAFVGSGCTRRTATPFRIVRWLTTRMDENRVGPLGRNVETGGFARGPVNRI